MSPQEFRQYAHELVDWMADYYEQIESFPVKSPAAPREIYQKLPAAPPSDSESFAEIMEDFERIILPGVTHWQHPQFYAYFPANASLPSLLAEMLTSTLGAQCMMWDTSPAAAELEERMMEWLRDLCGLPGHWHGVIQDTASTATLAALLSARERASEFRTNATGLQRRPTYRIYASTETHSSIAKAVRIAGFGDENLVAVAVDENQAMRVADLRAAIQRDRARGVVPLAVVATLGTTGTTAFDPLAEIAEITESESLWLHVDAAYAGAVFALPEMQHWLEGIEKADSYVFNPHKWMLTHFDCSAYFVADRGALLRTFSILPEYLKSDARGQVNDYRDWGIPLGRRFRALKLWFVMRSYGTKGIRTYLKNHLDWAQLFAARVDAHPAFERLAPVTLNLVCFRYHPPGEDDKDLLDELNAELLRTLNASGELYMTHTRIKGCYTLRWVGGAVRLEARHVEAAWQNILATAEILAPS